jgi:cytidyltransferase-related domain
MNNQKRKQPVKVGVFLARMQPVHNAHLWLVEKALEENDKVLIVLGSENKIDMLRNPYDIKLREQMLRECLTEADNNKLDIMTLPDWSMESSVDDAKTWGRYFYYNVVGRIGQKHFSIYYSDEPAILDSWFKGIEIENYVAYRNFDRSNLFEGLSSTKIRQAFIDKDIDYIKKFCPNSVVNRFDELSKYYEEVTQNPQEDFIME